MSSVDVKWDSSDEDCDAPAVVRVGNNTDTATATQADSSAAPSAGRATLTFVVDGSGLAPRDQQSNEVLRVWTSLGRGETHRSIEWVEGTGGTRSKPITLELQLDDEYTANEKHLAASGLRSQIHRKKPKGKPMPQRTARANGAKSKVRSAVEHVFARQKGPMGLFVRTIGLARARVKIGLANIVYNMKRAVWLTAKPRMA